MEALHQKTIDCHGSYSSTGPPRGTRFVPRSETFRPARRSLGPYRALIINHEAGHWLGRGHEACPGPGAPRPAPALTQRIGGLKGCVADAWPYGAKGRYPGGPSVP